MYFSSDDGKQVANWTEAKAICQGFHVGSTLVSIRDQVDLDSVNEKVLGPTCIGGSDAEQEGVWKWEDGSPFDFTHWGTNEPNGNETENCLELDYSLNFNDISCGGNFNRYYICASPNRVCPESW